MTETLIRARTSASDFFHDVIANGWDDVRAARFESDYGDDIRRLIVLQLWKLGLVAYRFDSRLARRILQDRQLELFENTLSDIWIALLKDLIPSYLDRRTTSVGESLPFLQYMTGVIRNLAVDNAWKLGLLPRESTASTLKSICKAKKESTRRLYLARAKLRLRTKVERVLLSSVPEEDFGEAYKNLYGIVEHFFEVYTPLQCAAILRMRGREALERLITEYAKGEFRNGLEYVGYVTPWDSEQRVRVEAIDDERTEEEFLTLLTLRAECASC